MRPTGLSMTAMSERARRILSLVPEKNADSNTRDVACSGDEAGMIRSAESSPAPSINSSLERLNLLQTSDDEIGTHADDIYTFLVSDFLIHLKVIMTLYPQLHLCLQINLLHPRNATQSSCHRCTKNKKTMKQKN
ncbi:unnamed protein product [Pieris brassicae]|uniref:Uncharacterized protein n=1 Tax=Pieris brassicae TaxID=7116 RepID=A0A9P0TIX1_PIEBR|nr:unnamed protein product [Pieris brassicae]